MFRMVIMLNDLGLSETDKRTQALIKRLDNMYDEAYTEIIKKNDKLIKKLSDATDDNYKKYLKRELKRNKLMIENMAKEIAMTGETVSKIIQGEMTNIYLLNYSYTTWKIQSDIGYGFNFAIYDKNQIAVILKENQAPFTKLAYRKLGSDTRVVEKLQSELFKSITLGESKQQLTKRIRTVTGQFNQDAKIVAQTERNRTASQGRQMGFDQAESLGIETYKQWIARLVNTRESHKEMNGQIVRSFEKFKSELGEIEFPGDPNTRPENSINCYCYVKPVVRTQSKALLKHREKFKEGWEKYRVSRLKQ